MANISQRFGRAVRKRRESSGYSQEAFATAAKIDRTYYSKIERGRANVSLALIERLVKTFGVDLADLFAGVDKE